MTLLLAFPLFSLVLTAQIFQDFTYGSLLYRDSSSSAGISPNSVWHSYLHLCRINAFCTLHAPIMYCCHYTNTATAEQEQQEGQPKRHTQMDDITTKTWLLFLSVCIPFSSCMVEHVKRIRLIVFHVLSHFQGRFKVFDVLLEYVKVLAFPCVSATELSPHV